MKLWQIIVAIAALAAVAYFAFPQQVSSVAKIVPTMAGPENTMLADFDAAHGQDFIWYNDTNNSFAFKYPIGYSINLQPDEVTYLRLSAFNPYGISETFDVLLLDSPYTQADFEDNAAKFPASDSGMRLELLSKKAAQINGRTAYVFYVNQTYGTDEPVFVESAVVNCDGYAADLISHVPLSALPDRAVAEYMIGSFRC